MLQKNDRYHRQIILKEFGESGQLKLLQSKVLVIGAGGLGCPVLQYLTAAGVGTIGIVDDDIVSLTNLHRQVLYTSNDIGSSKVIMAAFALEQLNDDIDIIPYNVKLTNKNAIEIITPYDIVIDGTDNFATRYLINDACVLLNKILVYGAISQYEGQVAVFNFDKQSANYRDLFPQPDITILNCEEAGVIGVLPGIIGCYLANETIKLVTGIGDPLINILLIYNLLNNQTNQFNIPPTPESKLSIPLNEKAFKAMDYDFFCSTKTNNDFNIDVSTFDKFLNNKSVKIIDVRDENSLPLVTEFEHINIPLEKLENNLSAITDEIIVTFCQSGKRSAQAAQILFDNFGSIKKIYSLQGGIVNWKKHHS